MRFILNMLWFLVCGWILFLAFMALGIALHLLVVTAPLGKRCFSIAFLALRPYGCKIDANFSFSWANVLWPITMGIILAATVGLIFFSVVDAIVSLMVLHVLYAALTGASLTLATVEVYLFYLLSIVFILPFLRIVLYCLAPFDAEIDRD